MKTTYFIMTFIVISLFSLTGCQNTVQGFGKDMQAAGKRIENSGQD